MMEEWDALQRLSANKIQSARKLLPNESLEAADFSFA